MANEKDIQPITQVVIFQPGAEPATFNTTDEKIARINAGLTDGVEKVAIEYKDGKRTIFIGMPYTIWTEPQKN